MVSFRFEAVWLWCTRVNTGFFNNLTVIKELQPNEFNHAVDTGAPGGDYEPQFPVREQEASLSELKFEIYYYYYSHD